MKTFNYEYDLSTKDFSYLPFSLTETLFFDIETTGLSANNSMIYLIGIMRYNTSCNKFILTQWFADSPQDEAGIITAFLNELSNYRTLAHFNGDTFDIPFVTKRCELLQIPARYSLYKSVDIYKQIKPLKKLLQLTSLKQKSIEEFLGIFREDKYDGETLIKVYREFVLDKSPEKEHLLLLHNKNDMEGLIDILPILTYEQILSGRFKSIDLEQISADEFVFTCMYDTVFPVDFSLNSNFAYIVCHNNYIKLKIKAFTGELKYFFDNYKDYYFLPLEDYAIHKSVAQFVDKEHRIKATKENCYTRKTGTFLPQSKNIFVPVYKENYKSKALYFEYNDSILEDIEKMLQYIIAAINA